MKLLMKVGRIVEEHSDLLSFLVGLLFLLALICLVVTDYNSISRQGAEEYLNQHYTNVVMGEKAISYGLLTQPWCPRDNIAKFEFTAKDAKGNDFHGLLCVVGFYHTYSVQTLP